MSPKPDFWVDLNVPRALFTIHALALSQEKPKRFFHVPDRLDYSDDVNFLGKSILRLLQGDLRSLPAQLATLAGQNAEQQLLAIILLAVLQEVGFGEVAELGVVQFGRLLDVFLGLSDSEEPRDQVVFQVIVVPELHEHEDR